MNANTVVDVRKHYVRNRMRALNINLTSNSSMLLEDAVNMLHYTLTQNYRHSK